MNDVVRTCSKTWKRLGVPSVAAAEMANELAADLAAAAEDGISAEDFVSGDAHAFALEWAQASGVIRPPRRIAASALAAVLGAVPGTGLALFVALGVSSETFRTMFPSVPTYLESSSGAWVLLALYGVGALFAYAGAIAGVAGFLRWRQDPILANTVRLLAITLPLGTAAAIGATVFLAWTQDFPTRGAVVLTELVVATSVFAIAVVATRLAAIRISGGSPAAAG
jgi:hypothetical protein